MYAPTEPFTIAPFRRLADTALAACSLVAEADVERRFGDHFKSVQPSERWSVLQDVIKAALCIPGKGEPAFGTLRQLRREAALEVALGLPGEPYAPILRRMADACRDGVLPRFTEEERWNEAIQAAQALRILNGDFPERNSREDIVVAAAQRLVAGGAVLRVENGRFMMDEAELGRLAKEIDGQVAALGGCPTVQQVLAYLVESEPLHFGRYAPGRNLRDGRKEPSLPIGYLLQLGVKHLRSPPAISARRPALWISLVAQARDLCCVLDVEPYSNLEDIVLDGRDVPSYLSGVALFDHLFALKQWPPSRALDLLSGVTAGLEPHEVESRTGWQISDVSALMAAVLKVAPEPFSIFTSTDLQQAGLPAKVWDALKDDFVHPLGEVNREYVSPFDADKAEFDFKPLFALPKSHLLAVTPGLACLSFFEATTRRLRAAGYPKLDEILGDAVENVVAEILRGSGLNVTVHGEEYFPATGSRAKAEGECDIVVETEKSIVFIELKKKPLRRVSSTGDAAAGLVDLSASMFSAQSQLARHEQRLLRDGRIEFANGYALELRGRQIDRIAMTWLDHGGHQDKVLLDQIFTALIGRRVTTDHPREGKRLKALNEAISALEIEIEAAGRLGKVEHAPFINCWFLSAPQLTMLLDGVTTPAEFDRRLGRLRHMSYRTLDFYRDFGFASRSGLI